MVTQNINKELTFKLIFFWNSNSFHFVFIYLLWYFTVHELTAFSMGEVHLCHITFQNFSIPIFLLHFTSHLKQLFMLPLSSQTSNDILLCFDPKLNVRLWPLNVYSKLSFLPIIYHLSLWPFELSSTKLCSSEAVDIKVWKVFNLQSIN